MFIGKSRTKAQDARFDAIKRGHCLACLQRDIDLRGQGLVQVHHLRGKKHHDDTVGLCYWHHQAGLFWGHSHSDMRDHYGPSLAEGSKPFHQAFGSDALLLDMQNQLLGEIA